jgi:hypothetical protein
MTSQTRVRDHESLLNPSELRSSLILVALYVLAFESFRDGAIDHVHSLYWCGVDENGHKYDEGEYRAKILSRHRSEFQACLLWYQEVGALTADDLASIDTLRQIRNRLVHELPALLGTTGLAPDLSTFQELLRIFRKLEVWNVLNLELEVDDEWRNKDIPEDEIVPGRILMMQMLLDVALGDEEKAWSYYNHMVRKTKPDHPESAT